MDKEEMFSRILEEKVIIDPLLWLIKIENQVDKTHEQYIRSMALKYKGNSQKRKVLEQYFELWKIK
jgi:hypothetical protein